MTADEIEDVRRQLKEQLDRLLACDSLWHDKVTAALLQGAEEQARGHRSVLSDDADRYGPTLREKFRCELLRDLIATGMAHRLLLTWAGAR